MPSSACRSAHTPSRGDNAVQAICQPDEHATTPFSLGIFPKYTVDKELGTLKADRYEFQAQMFLGCVVDE